ncbi:hypothetical protein D5086_000282 [Populus alba]|uniref:Uncharacterized protein n=1 Tax=Populus alba TaxID=43335 RepID=A0ACC4CVI1_POPAL
MDSTTTEDQLNNTEQQLTKYKTTSKDMLQESRQIRCRIANAIHVLSSLGFSLTLEVIPETIDLSSALNLGIDEMLSMEGLAEEMQFQAEETLAMLRTKMSCCKQKAENSIMRSTANSNSQMVQDSSCCAMVAAFPFSPTFLNSFLYISRSLQ